MRKHHATPLDDRDMQAETDERHGDLHAEETRAKHNGLFRARCDIAPDRFAVCHGPQVEHARKHRAGNR